VYNNTIIGPAGDAAEPCIGTTSSAITVTANNNICMSAGYMFNEADNSLGSFTSNDNVFYNLYKIATDNSGPGPPNYYNTLANWQGVSGQDMNSVVGNPQLDSNYVPQAQGNVIDIGLNLGASLGLPPAGSGCTNPGMQCLVYDKLGLGRPATGSWVVGAFNNNSSALAPPTGLNATVQ
jgi:hypothetical protein